ncbi:MAG: fibronectin type III domain-containing protein, partial [Bacteroidales bacterium]|nr:fibronectin type III domain-containing protein [Candidatus Colimorpha onthohippi]
MMPVSDTLSYSVCPGEDIHISDFYFRNGDVDSSKLGLRASGAVRVCSNMGEALDVSIQFTSCSRHAVLEIYDGAVGQQTRLARLTDTNYWTVTSIRAVSGCVVIAYNDDGRDSCASMMSVTVQDQGVGNYQAYNITGVQAELDWSDPDTTHVWTVRYGTSPNNLSNMVHARAHPFVLRGLDELTTYYYRVYRNDTVVCTAAECPPPSFRTICDYEYRECPDFTDFSSCRVTCYYGSYGNPRAAVGVVDYGSGSAASRHTVHTNT